LAEGSPSVDLVSRNLLAVVAWLVVLAAFGVTVVFLREPLPTWLIGGLAGLLCSVVVLVPASFWAINRQLFTSRRAVARGVLRLLVALGLEALVFLLLAILYLSLGTWLHEPGSPR
jgi:membrane protease YdiL (CAAX protease family)